jgi:hypothetical protein
MRTLHPQQQILHHQNRNSVILQESVGSLRSGPKIHNRGASVAWKPLVLSHADSIWKARQSAQGPLGCIGDYEGISQHQESRDAHFPFQRVQRWCNDAFFTDLRIPTK